MTDRALEGAVYQAASARGGFYASAKRAIDIALVLPAILLLLPLLGAAALLVSVVGGGPIFYRQPRVGRFGQPFMCLKFRTMAVESEPILRRHLAENPEAAREWRERQKLRFDPRVTALGRVLRRCSLDELPQLFNILRGEMSIVGPRPATEDQMGLYGDALRAYVSVRPGLTGPWQVGGRNDLTFEQRVRLEAAYAGSMSLATDLRIMLRTVRVVISGRGAC